MNDSSSRASHAILNRLCWISLLIWIVAGGSGCRTGGTSPRPSLSSIDRCVENNGLQIIETDTGYRLVWNEIERASISVPTLRHRSPVSIKMTPVEDEWIKVCLRWNVPRNVKQDELAVQFDLQFDPDFWWAPHLTPEEGYIIAQHVFRAPAIIAQKERLTWVLVPDLDRVGQQADYPWFMDYDARSKQVWLGLSDSEIPKHVLFKKKPGMTFAPGSVELGFYIAVYEDDAEVRNPWSKVTHFLWQQWARPRLATGEPIEAPMERYARHTYDWAFQQWKDVVWQEFTLDERRVGAPQFIVNYSQSPNFPGQWHQREFLSIWNQAWFSSLRSASGVFRYARETDSVDLLEKARLTKALALAAPMQDGLFPSVIRTPNVVDEIEGKKYARPKDWQSDPWQWAYWTNSNRRPWNYGIQGDWYHILDSSWTCLLMLQWHEQLEADPRLVDFSKTYAERLLTLQDEQGFFPGWLHPETFEPGPVMNQTPETSVSVTFLLKLAEITGEAKYRDAALKAMEAVLEQIVPQGRWEDFETYWSCCSWGRDTHVGKKVERNAMFKQNSLSIFYTAEALLECYRQTGEKRYLQWGRRTLDELSMMQQVWQPPYIYVPALGGFGVMNADGEWTDSRETLFAELFLDYYRETGDPHLFERGVAALRSGFIMMYCPENPRAKVQWEKRYPWFGPEDYGFTIENYGHGGKTDPEGGGIGPFTIYDWGNGAASEAYNRIHDHYGDVYIDRARGQGFGVDGIAVERTAEGWELTDLLNQPRTVRIVTSDGAERSIPLDHRCVMKEDD